MATIVKSLHAAESSSHLRPFDARRDLQAVADLIELGFADTLDDDGRRYLGQMRAAAKGYNGLGWLGMTGNLATYSMSGFVWEEDGRTVGNLSLIPYLIGAHRCYLIANVVVDPDYRRLGIGRTLTARAVEHARSAGCPAAWLQVREENAGAIKLYQSLGFIERARRSTWHSQGEAAFKELPQGIKISPRQIQHWSAQRDWLQSNYPKELLWNLPLRINNLRPGLLGGFLRIFSEATISQWVVQQAGRLCAAAAWQTGYANRNIVWLAAPPEVDESALQALLWYVRRQIPGRRPLALDYPAGQSETAIQSAGFRTHQTLIWMEIKF